MTANDRSAQLRRDLRAIVGDGVAFSVMVGAGESYIPAFALAAGLGEITAGLVATLPMLVGAAFQLVTPVAVRRLGSARRWVVLCASAQAASFAPLVLAALSGRLSRPVLFLAAAAYWGFGMATGPAWNTWVTQIVPRPIRSRFFAARSRWSQVAVLAGLIAGGLALQAGAGAERPLPIFAGALRHGAARARRLVTFSCQPERARGAPPEPLRLSPGAFLGDVSRSGARPPARLPDLGPAGGPDLRAVLHALHARAAEALLRRVRGADRHPLRRAHRGAAGAGQPRAPLRQPARAVDREPRHRAAALAVAGVAELRLAAGGAGRRRASPGGPTSWRRCSSSSITSTSASAPACSRCSTWRRALAVVIGAGCGSLLFRWLGPELPGYAVLFLISSSLRIAGLVYLRRSIGS